jgi:phage N-6-adenine-methyltransferase
MTSDVMFSSKSGVWETPIDLYKELDREFCFNVDVCATADNAKHTFYFTESDDGLSKTWHGVAWCNPPYGRTVGRWITKGIEQVQNNERCRAVVYLLPARTDTAWFHGLIWDRSSNHPRTGVEVRFLKGRLKFGQSTTGAPFPSMVVVIRKASA